MGHYTEINVLQRMKRNVVGPLPWRRDNYHAIFLVALGRAQRQPSRKHSIKWTILGLCNKDSRLSSKISKHPVGKFLKGFPSAETKSNGGVGYSSVRHWTWQKNFEECMQWVKVEAHSPKTQWFLCLLRGFPLCSLLYKTYKVWLNSFTDIRLFMHEQK